MSLLDWMDDCDSQQCYSLLSPQLSATAYSQTSHQPRPLRAFSYLLKGNSKISCPTTQYDLASGSLFNYIFFLQFIQSSSLTCLLFHKYPTNTSSMLPLQELHSHAATCLECPFPKQVYSSLPQIQVPIQMSPLSTENVLNHSILDGMYIHLHCSLSSYLYYFSTVRVANDTMLFCCLLSEPHNGFKMHESMDSLGCL